MDCQLFGQIWRSGHLCQEVLCLGLAHSELCGHLQVRPTAFVFNDSFSYLS